MGKRYVYVSIVVNINDFIVFVDQKINELCTKMHASKVDYLYL